MSYNLLNKILKDVCNMLSMMFLKQSDETLTNLLSIETFNDDFVNYYIIVTKVNNGEKIAKFFQSEEQQQTGLIYFLVNKIINFEELFTKGFSSFVLNKDNNIRVKNHNYNDNWF